MNSLCIIQDSTKIGTRKHPLWVNIREFDMHYRCCCRLRSSCWWLCSKRPAARAKQPRGNTKNGRTIPSSSAFLAGQRSCQTRQRPRTTVAVFMENTLRYDSEARLRDLDQLHSFSKYWYKIILDYLYYHMTKADDKLIALSAINQTVGEASAFEYLAGLWKQNLELDLLWLVSSQLKDRPTIYFAPNCSWPSVEGEI